MKGIYRFYDTIGKDEFHGLFVAESDVVHFSIGKVVTWKNGEGVLIEIPLESHNIQLVTMDPVAVKYFEDFHFASGINPLRYIA